MLFLAVALATAVQAKSSTIDFSTNAGLVSTCPPLLPADPKSLARDEERVAFAICQGLSVAKDVATWLRDNEKAPPSSVQGLRRIRAPLEQHLATITRVRSVLEQVKSAGPFFVVAPGTWEVDFDGDGQVSFGERHFFWTPRRGLDMSPFDPLRTEARLQAAYASPVIKVDRSDILWAIAYCDFAEAALNLVLAYDSAEEGIQDMHLVDPERIRDVAYRRLLDGIAVSMKLRQALLAETDDDHEWIANPRQKQTTFPLVMDEQTFATWETLLAELNRMLEGKALLGGQVETNGRRGLFNLTMGLCPPGQGIDVRELFRRPLQRPLDPKELSARCQAPTATLPMAGLAALASASIQRNVRAGSTSRDSGEWAILRHIYWIN